MRPVLKISLLVFSFCFSIILSASLEAATFYAKLEARGGKNYWFKLLHMDDKMFTGIAGRIDSPSFYLSKDGKKDPEAELDATINGFIKGKPLVGPGKLHPQCAFPERFRFLQKMGLSKAKKVYCKDFLKWKKGVNADSISLIFSSSFPNNPASIFGHTFIRLNAKDKKNDLLDYAASYSADTKGIDSGLIYAVKGIFGGYSGFFRFAPYYQKVNEYTNSESRDIYEYHLNLGAEGVERIVNHLWELYSSSYSDYWFFTENCSYVLGSLLELGRDDWKFTKMNALYYLPVHLVKQIVETKDTLKNVSFRPSVRRKLGYYLEKLESSEMKEFIAVYNKKKDPKHLKNVSILDALISFYDFKKHHKNGKMEPSENSIYHKILKSRAKFKKGPKEIIKWDKYNRPDLGHDAQRISLYGGLKDDWFVGEFAYKMGYHDLLNQDIGYEPYSRLDVGEFGISFNDQTKHLSLSHVTLLNVVSLYPITYYDPRFSWQANIEKDWIEDISEIGKSRYRLGGGGGLAFSLFGNIYFMAGGEVQFSRHVRKSMRLGPWVEWAHISNLFFQMKFMFRQRLFSNLLQKVNENYYLENEVGLSIPFFGSSELRFEGKMVTKTGTFKQSQLKVRMGYAFYF